MNPVALTIGHFELRWYAIFMLLAVASCIYLAEKEYKRFNLKTDFIFNMAFWAIIFGFIGARLYYVIFNWDYYGSHIGEILQIWKGGLAIHGGLIAGLITIFVYDKRYNARTIRYLDFFAVPMLLSQAIGRWGNFFNSEAHGAETTLSSLQSLHIPEFVINGMHIDGKYYSPTFFYESIACFVLFVIFLFVRRGKYVKVGTMTGLYLIGYGIIRFFIEVSRTDALMLAGFKMAQIVSVIMIIIGIAILMINARKSRFEDLYNDKNNIDTLKF
jgi:phosphatidylglycerol---prolipoprotein diacylglyceryl transferase